MALLSVLALALMAVTKQMPAAQAADLAQKVVLMYLVAQGAVDVAGNLPKDTPPVQ